MTNPSSHQGDHVVDLLPALVNGTLGLHTARRVRTHVAHCEGCAEELAAWQALSAATRVATEPETIPSLALLGRVWAEIDGPSRVGSLTPVDAAHVLWRRACALARIAFAQAPLLSRGIWAVSAAVVGASILIFVFMKDGVDVMTASLLGLIVPLISAIGVAFIYGPENDAGLEIALSTPVSPRVVLVSRLALVFGFNVCLALGLTVAARVVHGGEVTALAGLWIGPMLLLAGLSAALSVAFGSMIGVAGAAGLSCVHLVTVATSFPAAGPGAGGSFAAALWTTSPAILILSAALFALAVLIVPRREHLPKTHVSAGLF